MSLITRSTTLTPAEIQGIDDAANLIKILSNDHKLNNTMNNIQYAIEEVCQSDCRNYADINETYRSDGTDNNHEENNKISSNETFIDEDSEFPPMISTQGKQVGSTRYIWAGYVYARDGYTQSFRCSNRKLYECSGRAIIRNGKVKETKAHSHPREPHMLQVEQVKKDMILRAQTDKSIGLRTIYLEACKTEPLVRTHLGLDMMLNKMKKARNEEMLVSPKPCIKPKKKLDINWKWTKGWLDVPSGQDKIAFCKVCAKEIVSPTKIRVYNHFLSKMHKRAVLGFYRPPNKRLHIDKQKSSTRDSEGMEKAELSNPDSDQDDTYTIEVLDQFQEEVEHMKATKRLKKRKIKDFSSFYEEVIELQTTPDQQTHKENDLKISFQNECKPQSISEIKLSSKVARAPTISVHVWDPNTGEPTSGLKISLHKQKDDTWSLVCGILTDHCGKSCDLLYGENLTTGLYKIYLDTRSYYSKRKQKCLYPYIEIVFEVQKVNELYHFPVQLSPFAYNICRLSKP